PGAATPRVHPLSLHVALPVSELMRYEYDRRLSIGAIAMGGTVAIMIPPSITLVLYAIFAEQSVGRMLIAGVFPGLLIATLFGILDRKSTRLNSRHVKISYAVY